MSEAAPAKGGAANESSAATGKSRLRFLRRIPRSLLVTLLGIALTAWLLPAFSRQRDDRQKAQEIKTTLGSQIAAATSRALLSSNAALRSASHQKLDVSIFQAEVGNDPRAKKAAFTKLGNVETAYADLLSLWLADRIAIEANLRAYFNPAVIAALDRYEQTMRALFSISAFPWARWPADPLLHEPFPPAKMARRLGVTTGTLERDLSNVRSGTSESDPLLGAVQLLGAFRDLSRGVLNKENKLIRHINEAHVNGYSTSAHDLLHDLIP